MEDGMEESAAPPENLWLFGYGSIVWKHSEVKHIQSEVAFIKDYKRRFWQGSPDHRGTSSRPGRVASIFTPDDFTTLNIHQKDAFECDSKDENWRVYGKAFLVTPQYREQVWKDLTQRETFGFKPIWLPIYHHQADGTEEIITERAITFAASIENPDFVGFDSHANIAKHIASCQGESGTNRDYIVNLHQALLKLEHPDPHIQHIVDHLSKLDSL